MEVSMRVNQKTARQLAGDFLYSRVAKFILENSKMGSGKVNGF
jgi:hypothetical protein